MVDPLTDVPHLLRQTLDRRLWSRTSRPRSALQVHLASPSVVFRDGEEEPATLLELAVPVSPITESTVTRIGARLWMEDIRGARKDIFTVVEVVGSLHAQGVVRDWACSPRP